jgi:MarR family transcriptional regulator for hemolysin
MLDTVPMLMRIIRAYMRGHRAGLTVAQFRTLCYVSAAAGSSLSEVADSIGLSLPAMSRLVEGLVEKGFMTRRTCDTDRRLIRLSVTARGQATLGEARTSAQQHLAAVLSRLDRQEQRSLLGDMRMLREIFNPELSDPDAASANAREN